MVFAVLVRLRDSTMTKWHSWFGVYSYLPLLLTPPRSWRWFICERSDIGKGFSGH